RSASCNSNEAHAPVTTVTAPEQPRHQPREHAEPAASMERKHPRARTESNPANGGNHARRHPGHAPAAEKDPLSSEDCADPIKLLVDHSADGFQLCCGHRQ